MDKKLIGLIIAILIVVVTVSGCIGNEDSMGVSDNQVNNDESNEEVPSYNNNPNDQESESDPERNEEPEPPED
jgi:hypothetical protein